MEESRTAVIAALLGNLALAVLKALSAVFTGSAAMLAETLHSAADTGNQLLLALGMRLGRRPPDESHPFGYGKNVYFWAFVVSMMLFTLGGAFSIGEGIHKVLRGGDMPSLAWAFGVLAGAFVFESLSLTVALHSLRRVKRGRSLREFIRENRDPTILTVVLEDASALLSIVLAAAGLALMHATGRVVWDAVASIAIGIVLIGVAVVLAFENYSLLLGESAPADVRQRILSVARSDPAVERVQALRTMHLGPESILVVLEVRFAPALSSREVEAATTRVRERVAEAAGEPDTRRLVVVEASGERAAAPSRAA